MEFDIARLPEQAVGGSDRPQRCLRLLDAALAKALPDFDLEAGLLRAAPPADAPPMDPAIRQLPPAERRIHVLQPQYMWAYTQGRGSAAVIGTMAYLYRCPESRFHRDSSLLRGVRNGLRAYAERQEPSGDFVFCPAAYSEAFGMHEFAWRLEPLILAFLWVRDALPEAERRAADEMLRRGCAFLLSRPNTERCNRGVVWTATAALAAHFMQDEAYMHAARHNWELIQEIFRADGQIHEESGPDSNYSATTMHHLVMLRLYTGDACLDERILNCARWHTRMRDSRGVPFEGMSTRTCLLGVPQLKARLLPAEFCARLDPFFHVLAERYLAETERVGAEATGYSANPLIWARHVHQAGPAPAAEPEWYREYLQFYSGHASVYLLAKRKYQTAITFRSRLAMRGLQTWSYGVEPPLIHPSTKEVSRTVAWGLDTARMDPDPGRFINVVAWAHDVTDLPAVTVVHSKLLTHYIFSPETLIVVLRGQTGRRITSWAMNCGVVPQPQLEAARICFGGLRSYIAFHAPPPRLRLGDSAWVAEFECGDGATVFAFAGAEFRCDASELPNHRLGFSDPSGSYAVTLHGHDGCSFLLNGRLGTMVTVRRT